VVTLMRKMGIEVIYRKPRTSIPHPEHKIYPYLLRGLDIGRANHVWAAARYLAPGLVAHQSAKMEGELLKIPDFGEPPPGRQMIS